MCTLIVGIDRPRAGRLLLGANRDEALARPTVSPHILVREPLIVAGREESSFDLCDDKARFYEVFSGRIPMPETVPVMPNSNCTENELADSRAANNACCCPAVRMGPGKRTWCPSLE